MSSTAKPVMNLISERSLTACITDGWGLLGNNLWTMTKSSWPILLLSALCGGFVCLGCTLFLQSTVVVILVVIADFIITLLFLLQTILLIRKRHELGYFSSAKPWILWKSDTKTTIRAFWTTLKTIITTPRQWGVFLALFLICGLVEQLVKSIFSLPAAVLLLSEFAATKSMLFGDAVDLPASFPYLLFLFGFISFFFQSIALWLIYFPMAFGVGHFKFLQQEADNETHE